jgi:hypothetical protein
LSAQSFVFGIGAENSFQQCHDLTKHAGRMLLLPALLIDPNLRRRDVHLVETRVDPFDDRACFTCCPDAGASWKTASGMLTGVPSRSSRGVGHNESVGAQGVADARAA